MTDWFNTYQNEIRLSSFLIVFCVMALLEWRFPSRKLIINKLSRWLNNLSLIFTSSLLIRWVSPFALTGLSIYASDNGIGLFSVLDAPLWLAVLLSILLLDCAIYFQHRIMHVVPILWRLHRLHHSDIDYDVTTAVRFHPIEILLSFFIKAWLILLIGAPIIAVVIFEVLLSSLALFNHSNINLPKGLDSLVRLLVVTPDVHRIHHSEIKNETNSNYGFNLIIWDKLFGTYTAQAKHGDKEIVLGLSEFKDKKEVTQFHHLLIQPFKF